MVGRNKSAQGLAENSECGRPRPQRSTRTDGVSRTASQLDMRALLRPGTGAPRWCSFQSGSQIIQSNILPGFRIPFGSSARRSSRITRIWASPANLGRKLFFAMLVTNAVEIQSFSVGVNGNPRSPLKSLRSRLSLELNSRRMISGATRLPDSRRARRPLSQSSHDSGSSIFQVGTFDSKFIADFFYHRFTFRPNAKSRKPGDPLYFLPIHCQPPLQGH